jgi:predicted small integral membrane protein
VSKSVSQAKILSKLLARQGAIKEYYLKQILPNELCQIWKSMGLNGLPNSFIFYHHISQGKPTTQMVVATNE